MAILKHMESFFLKLYMILATIALLVDGATWDTRYNLFTVGILQEVSMECILDAGANFTGFYREGGIQIVNTNRHKIATSDNTVFLDISQVTEADYDNYYCNDTSGSDRATLEIQASLEQVPESPQILLAGDPGEIQYRVYGNPRPRKITWYFGPRDSRRELASIDNKGKVTDPSGGRYTIDNQGTLRVNKIKADDAGEYSILVKVSGGARLPGSVKVKVEFKLELKTKPPGTYTRAVGQNLFIPCEFLYADSDIKWTFTSTDGIVTKITDGISPKGLNLTAVSIASEGKYTCSASNKYGNRSVDTQLIQVIDPAKITTQFQGVVKRKLTTDYELVCAASGKPKPNVKLSKLKADTSGFEPIRTAVGQVSEKFDQLGIAHGGVYSCWVDNGAKTLKGASMAETKNMTLEVYASTEIIERSTTKSVVSAIGLNFTIQCSAKGYPYPKVSFIGNGSEITTTSTLTGDVVTAEIAVTNAVQSDFVYDNITCVATNAYGDENTTIPLTQILKAPSPKNLRSIGVIGLDYVEMQWDAVTGADKYYIYINGSMEIIEINNRRNIKNLHRKTYYSIQVASGNLAGIGKKCEPFTFTTADIVKPAAIAAKEFSVRDLTSRTATITWSVPNNIPVDNAEVLTYTARYCMVTNNTVVDQTCKEISEKKEGAVILKDLVEKAYYEIVVTAINQGKKGLKSEPFRFQTEEEDKYEPTPTGKTIGPASGLSSGGIAGIIVAIILIVLIVVDVFCCFFNNCGFSHCCFETFCASKDKKFLPVDTNETNGTNEVDGYEAQELEEKTANVV